MCPPPTGGCRYTKPAEAPLAAFYVENKRYKEAKKVRTTRRDRSTRAPGTATPSPRHELNTSALPLRVCVQLLDKLLTAQERQLGYTAEPLAITLVTMGRLVQGTDGAAEAVALYKRAWKVLVKAGVSARAQLLPALAHAWPWPCPPPTHTHARPTPFAVSHEPVRAAMCAGDGAGGCVTTGRVGCGGAAGPVPVGVEAVA